MRMSNIFTGRAVPVIGELCNKKRGISFPPLRETLIQIHCSASANTSPTETPRAFVIRNQCPYRHTRFSVLRAFQRCIRNTASERQFRSCHIFTFSCRCQRCTKIFAKFICTTRHRPHLNERSYPQASQANLFPLRS